MRGDLTAAEHLVDRVAHGSAQPGQLVPPVASAASVVRAVEAVAGASGHGWSILPSGAGHDAQILGQHVPSGMIFVPSIGGISHAHDEDTAAEHLVAGAEALLTTVLRLDEELS